MGWRFAGWPVTSSEQPPTASVTPGHLVNRIAHRGLLLDRVAGLAADGVADDVGRAGNGLADALGRRAADGWVNAPRFRATRACRGAAAGRALAASVAVSAAPAALPWTGPDGTAPAGLAPSTTCRPPPGSPAEDGLVTRVPVRAEPERRHRCRAPPAPGCRARRRRRPKPDPPEPDAPGPALVRTPLEPPRPAPNVRTTARCVGRAPRCGANAAAGALAPPRRRRGVADGALHGTAPSTACCTAPAPTPGDGDRRRDRGRLHPARGRRVAVLRGDHRRLRQRRTVSPRDARPRRPASPAAPSPPPPNQRFRNAGSGRNAAIFARTGRRARTPASTPAMTACLRHGWQCGDVARHAALVAQRRGRPPSAAR